MHPNVRKALDKGKIAEAVIIESYNNGESGDFTVDVMRAVSEKGVVFGGEFKHEGRKHKPDGYIQVGRTLHIFEMKDGNRYNEKYIGQVNRYAHVMNIAMDFDEVITYIIYGSRREVDVEVMKAEDISDIYAATRGADDEAYKWTVDARASMTDNDKEAQKEKDRERRANRTEEQKEKQRAGNRKYNAKPEVKAKQKAKRDNMTDEQREVKAVSQRKNYLISIGGVSAKDRKIAERDAQLVARTVRPKNSRERVLYASTLAYIND